MARGVPRDARVSVHLSLFHAVQRERVLTRSPGNGAAKSRGIRANPERRAPIREPIRSHTTLAARVNLRRLVSLLLVRSSALPSFHVSLSLSVSLALRFLALCRLVCVYSAPGPGADVSINSGTRRPSRLISIRSRHTYSMCHEIIGR